MKNQYSLEWTKKTLGNQLIDSSMENLPLTDPSITKELDISFGSASLSFISEVGFKVYCARRFTMAASGKNFLGYTLELTYSESESLYVSMIGQDSFFICPALDKEIFKVPNTRGLDLGSTMDIVENKRGGTVKIFFTSSLIEDVFFRGKRWKATYRK